MIHQLVQVLTNHQTRNVATNREAEIENDSSGENLLNDLARQIQSNFDIVQQYSQRPLEQDRIISCVEPLLREVNAAAYRPNFVIIGPLRPYDTILEQTEMRKRMHLASFLKRAEKKASLKDFCKLIKDSADQIRGCYEETFVRTWDFLSHKIQQNRPESDGSPELFIEMVLVDASFIIELFLRAYDNEGRHENDIFRRDLFLAHNQLPFFILKDIYKRAFNGNPDYPSFLHLTCHFFNLYYNQNISIGDIISPNNRHGEYRAKLKGAKHFTDLLRTLQLPYSFPKDSSKGKSFCSKWIKNKVVYFIDLIRSSLLPSSSKKPEESLESGEYLYSAVLLREAGVRFKVSKSRCLLDIEFNPKNGELKIPPLRMDESTESFFRNLMAWEKCYYPHDTYICDYIFLMEYLIKSTEDVDLLVRKRIIINQLGSNAAVVTLFNNFCKHITRVEKNSYSDIFQKLNAYNAVRRHSWIAILKLQYFSTLWKGVATIAAVILLVLTLIQTIIAVISLLKQ
ncbi:hypothetical protein REPUB_Repub11eG0014000 [Reevesia pubescens]